MAVCWRCPVCNEVSCEEDVNAAGLPHNKEELSSHIAAFMQKYSMESTFIF